MTIIIPFNNFPVDLNQNIPRLLTILGKVLLILLQGINLCYEHYTYFLFEFMLITIL